MAEDVTTGDAGEDAPKRRSTFTPPPEGAEVPDRLGELSEEDALQAKQASEAAASLNPRQAGTGFEAESDEGSMAVPATAPPLVVPPVGSRTPAAPIVPPAPVRTSLSDEQIMAQFRDGELASTEAMMNALESQLVLRQQEEEQFAAWEETVKTTFPEEEARSLVWASRRAFDGLPPLPEEPLAAQTPEVQAETEPVAPAVDLDTGTPVVNPLLASIASDTRDVPVVSESGGQTTPPSESDLLEERVLPPSSVPSDFDRVLVDPDAVTPPTDAWPLITEAQIESHEDVEAEPVSGGELEGTESVEKDVLPDDVEPEEDVRPTVVEPALVEGGITVGTETVTIREAVATRDIPVEPFTDVTVEKERWFSFDRVGLEPAVEVNRTAGALQLFWTWWAVSTPLGGILLGSWLMQSGMGLGQALLAGGVGALVGALPLILGTIVGVRSGLPTMVASRAAFGLVGNILPALLMVFIRVVVSAFFLWTAIWTVSGIYREANLWPYDPMGLDVLVGTLAVLLAGAVVLAGRRIVSLVLWVSAGLSALATAALIWLTRELPARAVLELPEAGPEAVVAGVSVVAAILMVLWAQSGADVARFGRSGGAAGRASMVGIAAVIPPLGFLAWGSLLAGSDVAVRSGLLRDPFDTLLGLAPGWYPIPALILLAVPLLGLAGLALHSSSYALMSLGLKGSRHAAAASVTVLAAALLFAVLTLVDSPADYLVDAVTFLGVVVAAWVGAFAGEVITRRVPLDSRALLGMSGSFPRVRVAPVVGFALAIAGGLGLTQASEAFFAWQGYLLPVLRDLGLIDLGPWQLGVPFALTVALVFSILAGIRGGVTVSSRKAAE